MKKHERQDAAYEFLRSLGANGEFKWVQIGSHPDGRIPIWFRDVTDFKLPDHKIHKCSNSFINSGSWI